METKQGVTLLGEGECVCRLPFGRAEISRGGVTSTARVLIVQARVCPVLSLDLNAMEDVPVAY